ncbi:MAG: recombinase RecA [Mycoplasmataceae bacterium]|nr:recombinase RecA [Mycoplasmataceae bacterium]
MKKNDNKLPSEDEIIDSVISKIEKDFGKGSVMKFGDSADFTKNKFSTGSIMIDRILGGGVPKGRIIEIFGPESSGKTSLTFQMISEIQKNGGKAAFIDAEHPLDLAFAKTIGVSANDLIISQPDSGEQAFEIIDVLVESNAFDLIVVDSVAALVPEIELKGEFSDQTIGAHARLMSKALRILTPKISKSNTTVVFINQIREKIGVMYGSPETTTGGRALKFYSSIRMDIRVRERLKNKDNKLYAQIMKIKVVKNKVAEPYREALIELRFDKGFNLDSELIDLAVEHEIIKKSGSWYTYNSEKIGQGKESVYAFFKEKDDIKQKIKKEVTKKLSSV